MNLLHFFFCLWTDRPLVSPLSSQVRLSLSEVTSETFLPASRSVQPPHVFLVPGALTFDVEWGVRDLLHGLPTDALARFDLYSFEWWWNFVVRIV